MPQSNNQNKLIYFIATLSIAGFVGFCVNGYFKLDGKIALAKEKTEELKEKQAEDVLELRIILNDQLQNIMNGINEINTEQKVMNTKVKSIEKKVEKIEKDIED